MFEQDSDEFPIRCPNCGEEFYEKVGRIKSGLDLRCPHLPDCGARLTNQAEEFDRFLKSDAETRMHYFRQFMRLQVPK